MLCQTSRRQRSHFLQLEVKKYGELGLTPDSIESGTIATNTGRPFLWCGARARLFVASATPSSLLVYKFLQKKSQRKRLLAPVQFGARAAHNPV
jgi:hypothetical protein